MGWGGDDNAAASANMRSALGGIGDFILRNQQWKVQKPNVEAQTRNTNASTDLTTAQTAAAKQAVSQGAESFPVALDQNKVALSTARLQNEMVGAQNQYNMSRLGYMGGFFGQGQNGVVPAAQGAATDAGVGAATAGARAMGAPVPNFSLTPPRAGGITTGAASPGSSASTGGPSQTIGSTPAPVADVSPVLGVDKGFNPELQVPPIGSGALLSLMQPGGAAPFAAGGKWTQEAASKATGVMKDAADAQSAESAATIAKRNAELGDPAEREKVLQFSNNAAHASHVLAQLDETVHKFGNFESSWAPGSNKVAAGNLTALPLQLADSLSKVVNPGAVLRNGMVEAQKEYNVPLPEHSWTAPFTSNVTTRQGIHLTKVMLARYIQNYENSPSNRGPVTGLTPEIRALVGDTMASRQFEKENGKAVPVEEAKDMFPDVKRDPSANLPGEGAAPEGPISSNVGSNRISAGRQTLPSITVPQLSTMRPGAASNGTVEGTQGGGMAPRVNSVNYTKGMDLTKLPPGTVLNFREGPRMWNGRQVTDLGSTSGARANP